MMAVVVSADDSDGCGSEFGDVYSTYLGAVPFWNGWCAWSRPLA